MFCLFVSQYMILIFISYGKCCETKWIVFFSHNKFVFYLTTLVLYVSQYMMSFLYGKCCETKRFVFLYHNICLRYMMSVYKEWTMLRDERLTFRVTTFTCMHIKCGDLYLYVCERCWNMLWDKKIFLLVSQHLFYLSLDVWYHFLNHNIYLKQWHCKDSLKIL